MEVHVELATKNLFTISKEGASFTFFLEEYTFQHEILELLLSEQKLYSISMCFELQFASHEGFPTLYNMKNVLRCIRKSIWDLHFHQVSSIKIH